MYKLIAIDLDGTLLNSGKEVSEENITAVKKVIEKGVKVVVCSGRVYKGAKLYAEKIGAIGPIITCNGALIKDLRDDKILYSNPLNKECCLQAIDICKKQNIYFHIYIDDAMYTECLEYSSLDYWKQNDHLPPENKIEINVVEDIKDFISNTNGAIYKMVIISSDSSLVLSTRKMVENIEDIDVTSSLPDNFEIVNKGVDKSIALKTLLGILDIGFNEIITIGDNENDHSMIKLAGIGIAMGNAIDSIKDIANFITSTNDENGIANALGKIFG